MFRPDIKHNYRHMMYVIVANEGNNSNNNVQPTAASSLDATVAYNT